MGRFASTVPFYERARQPYGTTFFAEVAARLRFDRTMRLLDLGTGPGLLALGFAPFVAELVGVDPEPGMLAAARRNARAAGARIQLIESRTEDLGRDIGPFDVVSIGRALHWMEPRATRLLIESVLSQDGVVLICSASSARDGGNPWLEVFEDLRRRWSATKTDLSYNDAGAILEGSGLVHRQTIAVRAEHTVAVEDLCDRVLSMSSSSPEMIGPDVEAMRSELGIALRPFATGCGLRETVVAKAEVLVRRPA